MTPLIFISHSGEDSPTAKAVVKLLRSALNLSPADIRCTSVDGHRLPAGVDTDEQLRAELLDAQVLLGIISQRGMTSAYVLFELGARWGAGKPLMPLLAPTVGPEVLRGPITGLNALRLDSEEQLHQLVSDVAVELGRRVNETSSFLTELKGVICSAFFAIKWLPRAPRRALLVLALQGGAAFAALAPVFFLNL